MSFRTYKSGQAKLSRVGVLLSGLALVLWGARSLALALDWGWFGRPVDSIFGDVAEREAWRLDVLVYEGPLTPAVLIAGIVALGGCAWCYWLGNRPKIGDALIEMETELRKVSWPGPADAWQSTLVVTGFTVALVATLFVYDIVIKGFLGLFVPAA